MDVPISRGVINFENPRQSVSKPWQPLPYDQDALTPGVVALGFGNFTRAFGLSFLHKLAAQGHKDVGVIGVPRSDREQLVFNRLEAQNFNYHLVERCAEETITRIGVLRGIVIGTKNPANVVEHIANPNTKLVTMTVTKDAYKLDDRARQDAGAIKDGRYDEIHNIAGLLVGGMHKRFVQGQDPSTVLSFDNFNGNGTLIKGLVVSMAKLIDPAFAEYVETKGVFPNTVVDRLAPKQNYDANAAYMAKTYGIKDSAAFVAEGNPALLVIERTLNALYPPFHEVGAKIVERKDADAYADLKLRGLNGYHKVVGMVGMILGLPQVHEVMEDTSVRPFILKLMDQAMAGLKAKPQNTDLAEHNRVTLERLDNRLLPDQSSRLVRDTWSSVPERIVNADAIERNVPSDAAAFATAVWLRYMKGHDDSGNVYKLTDGDVGNDKGPRMKQLGLTSESETTKNLGKHLGGSETVSPKMQAFVQEVMDYSALINKAGLRQTLELIFPATPATAPTPARPNCDAVGAHIGKSPVTANFTPAK